MNINITPAVPSRFFCIISILAFVVMAWPIKHFMGPVWWLAPLMLPIELISHFIRPLRWRCGCLPTCMATKSSLTIITLLVPVIAPLIIVFQGIFVSFIQGFVFILLSMIYIAGAEEHH